MRVLPRRLQSAEPAGESEAPRWANLAGAIGNQYWEEGRLFNLRMPPTDFRWHVGNRQPPGTSDTSRFATDHINNPNAINSIFNLAYRPTAPEKMADGTTRQVHHILKDGADSIGVAGASLRVYVNIGMCSDYWLTLHDPVNGRTPQQPFSHRSRAEERARTGATPKRGWRTPRRSSRPSVRCTLADAPGGAEHLSADAETLRRGKIAFADKCARCHSSKQPPREIATDRVKVEAWYRESVLSPDFLDKNFLSDDRRYPVYQLGTNIARAAGTNAMAGQVWAEFSSETYKAAAGDRTDQRPLQPAGSRQAARVGAEGRRPRLLPHADAHLDVGDGAVSPQQRARDVREGPVGARPAALVLRLDREAALARTTARRAIDHRDVDRQRARGYRDAIGRSAFRRGRRSISSRASTRARCRRSCRTAWC